MANCLQVAMASCSIPSSSSSSLASSANSTKRGAFRAFGSMKIRSSANPNNHSESFIKRLASLAAESPEMIYNAPKSSDNLPYLDLVKSPRLMAAPDQVERSVSSGRRRTRRSPLNLATRFLQSRVVYIGRPLFPAVTGHVVGQLLYLKRRQPKEPIYIYINPTGTDEDDFDPGALDSSGFAIYDILMGMDCEICTVCLGLAEGHTCLLLASGTKGKRFMLPDARAIIEEPWPPACGLMSASDLKIHAREAMLNRQTYIELLAKHTGNSEETIDELIRLGLTHMDGARAKKFGLIDKILDDASLKTLPNINKSPKERDAIDGVEETLKSIL